MKRLIIFLLLFAAIKVAGQTTGYLRFDTVRIMKQNGTCELYIINKTKDSLGLLTNVGGGLTRFIKSRMLNDSVLVIGLDTLTIAGATGPTYWQLDGSNNLVNKSFPGSKIEINKRLSGLDSGYVFTSDGATGSNPGEGTGFKTFWHGGKSALRNGFSSSTSFNNVNIGTNSFASGYDVIASANGTFAAGIGVSATGVGAGVLGGGGNHSSGTYSLTAGTGSQAAAEAAIALGYGVTASGMRSFVTGDFSSASGIAAAAFNAFTQAVGENSATFNQLTRALGKNTFVAGFNNYSNYTAVIPQFVIGQWNDTTNTAEVFRIGGGISNGVRRNLLAVDSNGHMYVRSLPDGDPDVDSLLVWDNADKKIKKVAPGSGADTTFTEAPIIVKTGAIDTIAVIYKHPIIIDGDSTLWLDTVAMTTRLWHNKGLDSIASKLRTEFPSVNPGLYYSPAQFANPAFMVDAVAIVNPINSFSHGTDIEWNIINYTSDHNSSFFDSAYGEPSNGRLYVRYPNVKFVYFGAGNPDEVFANQTCVGGASVGLTILQLNVYRSMAVGFRLTGDGAGTWTVGAGFPSLIAASTHNTTTGITGFNLTASWGVDYNSIGINYIGTNGYRVQRAAAFGIYNAAFKLVDEAGNPVTIDPSTSDEIVITNAGMQPTQVSMSTWLNNNNSFMSTASNWWIRGLFECWMVAAATSTTSVQVRWQTDYPSATNYKIYRSSTGLHGTYTLIHTGTSGTFSDTGLTPSTLYTYKMVAVVGGVDTDVTTFNANTKL